MEDGYKKAISEMFGIIEAEVHKYVDSEISPIDVIEGEPRLHDDLPKFKQYMEIVISQLLKERNMMNDELSSYFFFYAFGYRRGVLENPTAYAISSVAKPIVEYGIGILDDVLRSKSKNGI